VGDYIADTGILADALRKYIEEHIYALPGTNHHRDEFSILLTGSRAIGAHTEQSDVDIDVVCPWKVFEAVHAASLEAGIIESPVGFFCVLKDENPFRYFGERMGNPHFSLSPLETIHRQIEQYEDVPRWIWTNAQIIEDPNEQFRQTVSGFRRYPKEVLVDKIKYHWLAAAYWSIEVYPHHHGGSTDYLAAATALLNSINEHLRFFFLVEGKPYPYVEKLMRFAESTELGREFCPLFRRLTDLIIGIERPETDVWERLDLAFEKLCCYDSSEEARHLQDVCDAAMIAAGLEHDWVKADFSNIDELLDGSLGPFPL